MKSAFWKFVVPFLVALPVGFYTAFVAECFWNWFAVPALHVSEIGFLPWLGLWWLISLLFSSDTTADNKRWKILLSAVELCVPEEKQAALKEMVEFETEGFSTTLDIFGMIFGKLVGNTVTLGLGFALHLFIS
jgi:hypothetical protein